jgi:branched-subunit amino acid aminotransferase/4-amino-4-deoxychorismate lyase
MHSRVLYNQELLKAGEPRIPLATPATLFGRGVFTTIAIHGGRPFLWDRHWARIVAHAGRAGVDLAEIESNSVLRALDQLLKSNRVREGRARLSLLAHGGGGVWSRASATARKTDVLLMTADARPENEDGLAITVSPYRVNTHSPLVGIKSLNYLEQILAWEEAQTRDFAEAVRLNERGAVVSCAMANIFWAINGTVHTPALSTGALAGTTRETVIELAREMSIPLIEGVYELPALADADEIFITSAGRGVALVTTFDFHRYSVAFGSIGLRLHEAWRQLITTQ